MQLLVNNIIVKPQFFSFMRAQQYPRRIFFIAYNTLHYTTFRMSGRSYLVRLMVFSNTSTRKLYILLYIYDAYVRILCSVKRKFQCPISQLTKTIFTCNFEGDLIDHQSCFIPNFKFLAVQEPNFLEPKFGQNGLLTGFCMYIDRSSVFVLYLDLTSGLCRAVFPMYLVSRIGLPAY